ncbi:hypothetical protein CYMTET_44574 [Cymbomonas tetramitiformis]|uniref:Uncharacterized protein n=1 Tax=Cymbomonas tetramitiformis TaxID=36881 RepID=A0AAE0C222_9CHLO|nr:hypothetical protein CYMTET_44574 [Cymbomonas tetramitiformis]
MFMHSSLPAVPLTLGTSHVQRLVQAPKCLTRSSGTYNVRHRHRGFLARKTPKPVTLHSKILRQHSRPTFVKLRKRENVLCTATTPLSSFDVSEAQVASLESLQWSAICLQVAGFTSTAMGYEAAAERLPIGRKFDESVDLLRQTEAAREAEFDFTGIYDIRVALEAADEGKRLSAQELAEVAATLGAVKHLACMCALEDGQEGGPLWKMAGEGLNQVPTQLQDTIDWCIGNGNQVLDRASKELVDIRQWKEENGKDLRAVLNRVVRELVQVGAAERAQVLPPPKA